MWEYNFLHSLHWTVNSVRYFAGCQGVAPQHRDSKHRDDLWAPSDPKPLSKTALPFYVICVLVWSSVTNDYDHESFCSLTWQLDHPILFFTISSLFSGARCLPVWETNRDNQTYTGAGLVDKFMYNSVRKQQFVILPKTEFIPHD
jgi:hypothetical protein